MVSRKTAAVWITVFLVMSFILVWAYFIYKRYIAKYFLSHREQENHTNGDCHHNNGQVAFQAGTDTHRTSFLAANSPFTIDFNRTNCGQPPPYDLVTAFQDFNELPPSYEEATKHLHQSSS